MYELCIKSAALPLMSDIRLNNPNPLCIYYNFELRTKFGFPPGITLSGDVVEHENMSQHRNKESAAASPEEEDDDEDDEELVTNLDTVYIRCSTTPMPIVPWSNQFHF